MPRKRSIERDKAYEMYASSNGKIKLKDIASELSVSDVQIRQWKNQDRWDEKLGQEGKSKDNVIKSKSNVMKKSTSKSNVTIDVPELPEVEPEIENDELDILGLNARQRLFVKYYAVEQNATQAAIKAGYSKKAAGVVGHEVLNNPKIRQAIRAVRARMEDEIDVTTGMIINQLWKIASADINDFIQYHDSPPVRVVDPETGDMTLQHVKTIEVKPSNEVDGTLISEIRQTRDGIAFKRYDALEALKTLAKIKGMLTDKVNVEHSGEVRQINEQHYHITQEVIEQDPSLVRRIFNRDRITTD